MENDKAPAGDAPAASAMVDTPEALKAEHAEIKRKRGRPRKDGGAGPGVDPRPVSARLAPVGWTSESAKVLIVSEGLVWSGFTGFSGYEYSEPQQTFLSPILADVLNEWLPYEASWVRLAAFCAAYAGIKSYQIKAHSDWKASKKAKTSSTAPVENGESAKG